MSDNLGGEDSRVVHRALGRCKGGSDCDCDSHSSSTRRSPAAPSPSGSRTTRSEGEDSGDDSGNGSRSNQGNSDTSIPEADIEPDWSGLSIIRIKKCDHGRHCAIKKVWGGANTGRRFMCCPLKDEADQCQFRVWLDDDWPERVKESLRKLWRELKVTRHCEARANEALHEALECSDTATLARAALQEEVQRTKQLAQCAYTIYQRRAAAAVSKLMYLMYCLIGVIIVLAMALVFKKN